ncbi:hypothetical protein [Secundilactobacillus collinoides]|uniref:Peptidase S74 domain-containing protein n=1 Tax=Secundilactobacillus collinoides TaxID=33960 RepID=A0A166GDJ7_SECCO|nr:hypothetical protein [Secundilactobacillus collinoides]KZL38735.1 hypothetical protein TY91_11805 [Secundilactobacillus collinoides]
MTVIATGSVDINEATKIAQDASTSASDSATKIADLKTSLNGTITESTSAPFDDGKTHSDGDMWLVMSGDIATTMYTYADGAWTIKQWSASSLNVDELSALTANLGNVNAGTINGVTVNGSAINGSTFSETGTNGSFNVYSDGSLIASSDSGTFIVSSSKGYGAAITEGGLYVAGVADFTGTLYATDFRAAGNIGMYSAHVINSVDGGNIYFQEGIGSGNSTVQLYAAKYNTSTSRLSTKRNVELLDDAHSNSMLLGTDTATFQYNQETNADNSSEGVVIDDENDTKQYSLPNQLIAKDGLGPTDLMSFITRLISQNKYQSRLIEDLQIRLRKLEIENGNK